MTDLSPAVLADYSEHDLDTHDLGVFVLVALLVHEAGGGEIRLHRARFAAEYRIAGGEPKLRESLTRLFQLGWLAGDLFGEGIESILALGDRAAGAPLIEAWTPA